jgi:ubiquitin C-terminal hydrolase
MHPSAADEGQDEWEVPAAPPSDRPLGLTNIANTCYLNSLLQVSLSGHS